jgi:beta-lactamase regulating signal transducer with metallopeptidase domain
MLFWFVETTLVAAVLATIAVLASRYFRLPPVARHLLWLVVLIKLLTPPIVSWPWSFSRDWPVTEPVRPVAFAMVEPRASKPKPRAIAPAPRKELRDAEFTHVNKQMRANRPADKPAFVKVIARRTDRPAAAPLEGTALAVRRATRGLLASVQRLTPAELGWLALMTWSSASVAWVAWQMSRITRFQKSLTRALPAPNWLVQEAEILATRLGVPVPHMVVVPNLATPLLWFIGRPQLLLPPKLVHSLGAEGWRGILAHELAHLRRWDHWVRRLELVAGVLWWWNPLYWLTRRRLEAEAELACDEWAVRAFPEGRFAYAEALLHVCHSLTLAKPPVPALGIAGAGAGRFLERRVTMIVRDPAPRRAIFPVVLGAIVLAALALPGWTASASPTHSSRTQPIAAAAIPSSIAQLVARAAQSDNVADDDDDDDDDDAKAKAAKKAKARKAATAAKQKAKTEMPEKAEAKDKEKELEELGERIGKEIESLFGPGSDFMKQMEELGPKLEKSLKGLEKELEAAFGPGSDFEKKLQDSIKDKFGDSSELGEKLSKELKEKLGTTSELGEKLAKELGEKLGPGSDFDKKMKEAFGPGSEMDKKLKGAKKAATAAKQKPKAAKKPAPTSAKPKASARSAQIKELRAQIEKLTKQLEKLEDQDDDDDDNDENNDNDNDNSR